MEKCKGYFQSLLEETDEGEENRAKITISGWKLSCQYREKANAKAVVIIKLQLTKQLSEKIKTTET